MCVSYFHLAKYGLVPSANPSLQQLFTKNMGQCHVQARVTRNMDKCQVQATLLMWFGPLPTLFPAQTVAATTFESRGVGWGRKGMCWKNIWLRKKNSSFEFSIFDFRFSVISISQFSIFGFPILNF